jgi:hypothetical protein
MHRTVLTTYFSRSFIPIPAHPPVLGGNVSKISPVRGNFWQWYRLRRWTYLLERARRLQLVSSQNGSSWSSIANTRTNWTPQSVRRPPSDDGEFVGTYLPTRREVPGVSQRRNETDRGTRDPDDSELWTCTNLTGPGCQWLRRWSWGDWKKHTP